MVEIQMYSLISSVIDPGLGRYSTEIPSTAHPACTPDPQAGGRPRIHEGKATHA